MLFKTKISTYNWLTLFVSKRRFDLCHHDKRNIKRRVAPSDIQNIKQSHSEGTSKKRKQENFLSVHCVFLILRVVVLSSLCKVQTVRTTSRSTDVHTCKTAPSRIFNVRLLVPQPSLAFELQTCKLYHKQISTAGKVRRK